MNQDELRVRLVRKCKAIKREWLLVSHKTKHNCAFLSVAEFSPAPPTHTVDVYGFRWEHPNISWCYLQVAFGCNLKSLRVGPEYADWSLPLRVRRGETLTVVVAAEGKGVLAGAAKLWMRGIDYTEEAKP